MNYYKHVFCMMILCFISMNSFCMESIDFEKKEELEETDYFGALVVPSLWVLGGATASFLATYAFYGNQVSKLEDVENKLKEVARLLILSQNINILKNCLGY